MPRSPDASHATRPATFHHAQTVEELLRALDSSARGLSEDEAGRRLAAHGPNVVARAEGDSALRILWRQINSPLIWVLLGSSALAVVIGKPTDGLVVLSVVLLNGVIGFVQEFRARNAISSLAAMVPEQATVLRDGSPQSVPVATLVPGDVVTFASGDRIPADLRLLAQKSLRIDESPLTGESVPVEKDLRPLPHETELADRANMAYGGTLVSAGTGTGLVVVTGERTEMGRISQLLASATELETPLTRALAGLSHQITIAIGAVTVVMVAVGTARAVSAGLALGDALREVLVFAIALAVGAIPEGLPAIVTIALAIGVRRMAARRAIVRKLPAVETLGSTTVICSDKTGTLTRNEMTVRALRTTLSTYEVEGTGYAPTGAFVGEHGPLAELPDDLARALLHAALCSDATLVRDGERHTITGDPTEGALVVAAEKAGLSVDRLRSEAPRLDTVPFESEHRFMATLHRAREGGHLAILKGAPEAVLERLSALGDGELAGLRREVERMAGQGMRVLAVAHKSLDEQTSSLEQAVLVQGFQLSALVGMIDPPRSEVIEAIGLCRRAGIVVKMITGDHQATAQAIGRELGLSASHAALTGRELSTMDRDALADHAESTSVFARVAPEHKLALVDALQRRGHVVAMTGDGVNDAPALRQANIGVAMGITGTSVSKESADMVLVDDNFATIVAAVEEGRRVYDNLVKSLAFVLPTNLALALIMVVAVLLFPFDATTQLLLLPIAPTQLLWINLVAAVTLALPLAFEAKEPDLMARPPRRPNAPVLSRALLVRTAIAALLMTAGVLFVFRWELGTYLAQGSPPARALAEAQAMGVTTAIAFQVFYVLDCRSLRAGLWQIGLFSNPWIYLGIAAICALQAAFLYSPPLQALFDVAPLGLRDLAVSVGVGALALPIMALQKSLWRTLVRRERPATAT